LCCFPDAFQQPVRTLEDPLSCLVQSVDNAAMRAHVPLPSSLPACVISQRAFCQEEASLTVQSHYLLCSSNSLHACTRTLQAFLLATLARSLTQRYHSRRSFLSLPGYAFKYRCAAYYMRPPHERGAFVTVTSQAACVRSGFESCSCSCTCWLPDTSTC